MTILCSWLSLLLFVWSHPAGSAQAPTPEGFQQTDSAWVRATLAQMSLQEKVGQLIKIRIPGRFLNRQSEEFKEIEDQIRRNHVGGVVLFAGNVYDSAILVNELQRMSKQPLLVAADFERGAAFRVAATTSFPWTMAVGATGSEELSYQQGVITAKEARALGVHWVYAPVMDVNNNPDNPVINIRSYGEDPQLVGRLGSAFIRGCRDYGVMTTAKHFPGHGDTDTDSHIGLAVIHADRTRLQNLEWIPFQSAIQAGVDSVMTAHVAMPKVTGEARIPATLSSKVLTDMLRNTLKFGGLIVTDALEMGGITGQYWSGRAAVRALEAGADMLLLPPHTDVAVQEVLRAVERGDLTQERIDQSVIKILAAKSRLGLHRKRTIDIDRLAEEIAQPGNQALGQSVADRSITLVKDTRKLLPLNPLRPPKIFSLVMASDLNPSPGSLFQSELRARFPDAETESVDPRTPESLVSQILARAAKAEVIVCSTLVRVTSSKGHISMDEGHRGILRRLLATGKPVIWIAFGNPYVLRLHSDVAAYLCTFSDSDVSQIAAAKALSGEISVTGKMPVSIPGQVKVGEGIRVPRLDMALRVGQPRDLGLADDAFDNVRRLLSGYVQQKAFPGAALIVGYRGFRVLEVNVGNLDYSKNARAVDEQTIYDLASLSKVVGTTTAAMLLYESRQLQLQAPVQDYLPEFQGPGKEEVRVEHLLRHSAGLPAYLPLFREADGYRQVMSKVYAVPLEYRPGEKIQYSDLGTILLGEIISRAAARPLDQLLAERVFAPLGMTSTFYRPSREVIGRIAPTEEDPWRKRVVRGEVHDENAFAMGGVAGHAGLFATAKDLALFAQLILNQGMYEHRRFFRSQTVQLFTSRRGQFEDVVRGLGWAKPSPANWTGRVFSPSAVWHTGFTGTALWIDPDKELFIVFLSNHIHPKRGNTLIVEARRVIAEAVVGAVSAKARAR